MTRLEIVFAFVALVMKITFIGHASVLIESRGVRILSDPWWKGPCFGAQWWIYPPPYIEAVASVDFVYVSHGHNDHFHPGTLRSLEDRPTALVSRSIDVAPALRELSFPVVELDDDTLREIAPGVQCRIIETHNADTLFAIDDGERVCINLNDSLHAAPIDVQDRFIALLKSLYPRIDYLLCGYGVASHFPNCYEIPGKDRVATAAKRQAYFNQRWAHIVEGLSPAFAFPFAADVVLLERDLIWSNEPTQNAERPTTVFRAMHSDSRTIVFDVAPGFEIEGDEIARNRLRQPISLAELETAYRDNIERANTYGGASSEVLDEVIDLVRANVTQCLPYLRDYPGDYRFLVRFHGGDIGIRIEKRGSRIEVEPTNDGGPSGHDVTFTTRLHYLRRSMTDRWGHEILFVGSGGIFHMTSAGCAERNLHRELIVMLQRHDECPRSRYGNNPPVVYRIKRMIRKALSRSSDDLYDLIKWTVWSNQAR